MGSMVAQARWVTSLLQRVSLAPHCLRWVHVCVGMESKLYSCLHAKKGTLCVSVHVQMGVPLPLVGRMHSCFLLVSFAGFVDSMSVSIAQKKTW